MTSPISKPAATCMRRLCALVLVMFTFVCAHAQHDSTAAPQPPALTAQLAALQRLEAMQPDSVSPKYRQATLLLGYACTWPHDSKTRQYTDEAQRVIGKIEALHPTKAADRSDLATLHGFYFTALIVADPQQNGPRYYRQALDSFDEALRLNPDNALARQLQEQYRKGMGQTGNQ